MIKMATDAQYTLFQGNASNSSGGASNNETCAYNANAFDGYRGVLGSVGVFSGNNAIQIDVGSQNITESIQTGAAKIANNGGNPTAVFLSITAKQALDQEQQSNQRYNNDFVEVLPGVRLNQLNWANGQLAVLPVPGNTIGSYNRTSDGALVEDIYILDESANTIRWLYSEGFTVIQIPTGVDGVLSERYIIFGMYGLEQAAPLFNAKVRKLV